MIFYPALLTKSIADAKEKLKIVKGIKRLHLDVMDGDFVKNKTIPILRLKPLLRKKYVQAHIMCYHPEKYIADCKKIGVKEFIFHIEATRKPEKVIEAVKKKKMKVGIALNPITSLKRITPYLTKINTVLVMTVHPGFSGQQFQRSALKKIPLLRKRKVKVGVDGGVSPETAKLIKADFICAASSVFKAKEPKKVLKKLQRV